METYILKNSYYVALFCIHACLFSGQRGRCFKRGSAGVLHDRAGTTLVGHEARFFKGSTAVLKNSRGIMICLSVHSPETNLLNWLGRAELVLTWKIPCALSSASRFCITVSGHFFSFFKPQLHAGLNVSFLSLSLPPYPPPFFSFSFFLWFIRPSSLVLSFVTELYCVSVHFFLFSSGTEWTVSLFMHYPSIFLGISLLGAVLSYW